MINLTPQQLRQAANLQEKIAGLEKQLSQLLGNTQASKASTGGSKMSAAARAKIAAAQRKRWAQSKGKASAAHPAPAKKKAMRKMSAAAKAKLSQLAKARWAKVKAAGKKTL